MRLSSQASGSGFDSRHPYKRIPANPFTIRPIDFLQVMRSPLCMAKMFAKDGSFWRPFFSAATARGTRPLMIVYMRPPTDEERAIVEEHALASNAIFFLDVLIQHYMFGSSKTPAVLVPDLADQLDSLEEEILSDEPFDPSD